MKTQLNLKSSVVKPFRKTIGVVIKQYTDLLRLREEVRMLEKADDKFKRRRSPRERLSIVA